MSGQGLTTKAVRASDGERERVVELLKRHLAQGRLTLEELEERTGAAYAASSLTDHVALGWARWAQLVGLMWLATTPITALGALLGLTFAAEAAQGATNLAFLVLWLLGGIFTPPDRLPDALAAVARALPSYGVIQVGQGAASGDLIPGSAVAVLAAWTLGAGALAALAWRRVLAR